MPRIKDWKDLHFCRASRECHYEHIDDLFNASVDWDLLEEHFPDMMRVAPSIKAGKLLPSTILRRLASYSHKNKLYQAFNQLGRVVRTIFLLKYLDSVDLRRVIGVATNKSERWNKFLRWINFGGRGLIAEVARDEQRKFIKYNRNAGNILMVHTSILMSAAAVDESVMHHARSRAVLGIVCLWSRPASSVSFTDRLGAGLRAAQHHRTHEHVKDRLPPPTGRKPCHSTTADKAIAV